MQRIRIIIVAGLLTALSVQEGLGQSVTISLPDTVGKPGDTLLVPVRITPLTTLDSVFSGQFTVQYNGNVVKVIGIEKAGTLLESDGNPLYLTSTNRFGFAAIAPISGSAPLIFLRVVVLPHPVGSLASINLTSVLLNEGTPSVTSDVFGTLRVLAIALSPKNPPNLAVGDSLQFSLSGDVLPPVNWQVSDNSFASISSTGKLHALSSGGVKVYATDAQGLKDSTSQFAIFPASFSSLTIRVRDTAFTQTRIFDLPVYISDVTGIGITSAQFTLGFNSSILEPLGIRTTGSMAASWQNGFNLTSGSISIALAGSDTLVGSGVLVYVRLKVKPTAVSSTGMNLTGVQFNENISATVANGTFTPIPAPVISISPVVTKLTKGDQLTFGASGGTPPYRWSSSNSAVASVDSITGHLNAHLAGSVTISAMDSLGFVGTTGTIVVSELRVKLPNVGVLVGDSVDVPILVDDLTGLGVVSFEMRIAYDSTVVRPTAIIPTGTLSSGFTIDYKDSVDTLRVAASGITSLSGGGTLLKLRFTAVSSTIAAYSNLKFAKFQFNEGTPSSMLVDGRIVINAADLDTSVVQLPSTTSELGDPQQRPRWSPVGVSVQPGDSLFIFGSGTVNDGGGNSAGPDGTGIGGDPNPSYPDWYNSVSHLALIGRLRLSDGTVVPLDDAFDASGTGVYGPGFVGTSFRALMNQSGDVEVSINDGDTYNNSGSFSVTAYKLPPPGSYPPPPPSLASPLNGTTGVETNPTLTWSPSTGALTYRVQFSLDSTFAAVGIDSTNIVVTTLSVTGLSFDTIYYWRVQASNNAGASSFSAFYRFRTVGIPPTPILASPSDNAVDVTLNPVLRWFRSTTATSYRLQVSTDGSFSVLSLDSASIVDSSFALSNLNPNLTYHWRVSATNAAGQSAFSSVFHFTTVASPVVPTLISPADSASNLLAAVTLVWLRSANATSYRLQVSTSSTFSGTLVDSSGISDSSFTLSALSYNTTFYWRVSASNEAGVSGFSSARQFATLNAPSAPVLANPPDSASNMTLNVTLRWFRSTNAAAYRVQVSTDQAFSAIVKDSSGTADSSLALTGLNISTTYFWRVNASNVAGTSAYSLVRRFTTVSPPAAPILITPADSATGVARNLTLRWNRSALATSYRLQVSTGSNFATTALDSLGVPDSLCLLTNLSANTTYFWRVSAANSAGSSAFSTTWRFTTGTSTAVLSPDAIPTEFKLQQNYPNPFNPSTTIEYQLPRQSRVVLSVYNILGELVAALVDNEHEAGFYTITWRADLPTGMYLYRIQAGDFVQTKRLILLK